MKKIVRALLLVALTISSALTVGYAAEVNEWDSPMWRMREEFYGSSSWDRNGSNASIKNDMLTRSNMSNIGWSDGSTTEYAEAYRGVNPIEHGKYVWDFDFAMDRRMDDVKFTLMNDRTVVIGIVTKNKALYLEQSNGEDIYLGAYTTSLMVDGNTHYVKVEFDMDQQKVTRIFLNGKIVCENVDFTNPETRINAFSATSGVEATGSLRNSRVYLYGGYNIREDFYDSRNAKPDDWNMDTEKGKATITTANIRVVDKYSASIDTAADSVRYYKKIEPVSENQIFEINVLQPTKRDGLSFAVKSDGEDVFSVTTDGKQFIYNANGTSAPFYEYMDNVWYNLRYDIDLENHTVDLYLNHKLKAGGLPINPNLTTIDEVEIYAAQNEENVIIDDILLHNKRVLPDDYVPEPVKPKRKDESFLLGMQMCPLWTEGAYNNAWDTIKKAPDRALVLGCYDEGISSELSDWQTKYMVENGFDFEYICAYPPIPMPYTGSSNPAGWNTVMDPVKPNLVREGNTIFDGHMLSEYGDMLDFAIIIEIASLSSSNISLSYMKDIFFDTWLPYYIEYYFKDERYAKIDGRPIIGLFSPKNFKNMFDDGRGKEAVREGIAEIKRVCKEAGVGEPYFIVQCGYNESDVIEFFDCGFDALGQYNNNGVLGKQIDNLNKRVDHVAKYNMDNVIDVAIGFDVQAWNDRNENGLTLMPNEFESLIEYTTGDYMNSFGSPSGVSKKIVMAETWDEYGEGHWIAPDKLNGFTYLNKFRDVLCEEGDYENVYPTEEQLKRINTLVVQDRKATYYSQKPKTEVPTNVKKEWNFSNTSDANAWTASKNIESISVDNGKLVVTANGAEPTIMVNNTNIDLHDVTYVKVRMNKPSTSSGAYVSWTSSFVSEANKGDKIFYSSPEEPTEEMIDFYFPVVRDTKWKGTLYNLYIDLGYLRDYSEKFVVESIQLLSDPEFDKTTLKSGNETYSIPEITVKNGTVMIPVREVVSELGGTVGWYGGENAYSIRKGSNSYIATIGSTSVKKNGVEATIDEAPYSVSEIINDTAYLPMEFVAEALDMNMEYDETEHILYASNKENEKGVTTLPNRDEILIYDFNDGADITIMSNISNLTYVGGVMSGTASSSDPMFRLQFEGLEASSVKTFRVKMNTSAASMYSLYFLTESDQKWNEAKTLKGTVSAGDNLIEVDVSGNPNWTGKITNIRFDPITVNGATFELDYIAFMGDEIGGNKERVYDMTSCTSVKNGQYIWSFDKNSDLDGWGGNKSIVNLGVYDGVLTAKVAGSKPTLTTRGDIPYNAEDVSSIEIKMANTTSGRKAKLYYTTDTSTTWSEANSVTIDLMPNNTVKQTYTVDFSGQQGWSGKIRQLMLVPTDGKGDISIDSIVLKINE